MMMDILGLRRWEVLNLAQVGVAHKIWLGTIGNGLPTGMPRDITNIHQLTILEGQNLEVNGLSEEVPHISSQPMYALPVVVVSLISVFTLQAVFGVLPIIMRHSLSVVWRFVLAQKYSALVLFGILLLGTAGCSPPALPPPTPTKTQLTQPEISQTLTNTIQITLDETAMLAKVTIFDTWTRPTDGAVMVFVPGGSFLMGSSEAELEAAFELCEQYRGEGHCRQAWFENEAPQHEVTLDSFWIDRTEVTYAQYDQCVADGICNPVDCLSRFQPEDPLRPVGCITWPDPQVYCKWAGARLPTEAEWEYAARGPEGFIFPWGNPFDPTRLNYCDINCTYPWKDYGFDDKHDETSPGGTFDAGSSWCGAQDMAGNSFEWVSDWYDPNYYANSPSHNPQGPESGEQHIIRGGSAHWFPPYQRGAKRTGVSPLVLYASSGIRCAADTSIPTP